MFDRESELLKLDELVTELTVRDVPCTNEELRRLDGEITQILMGLRTRPNHFPSWEDFADEIAEIKRKREIGQKFKAPLEITIAQHQPQPLVLTFDVQGKEVGVMRFNNGEMTFEGDADASSTVFLLHLATKWSEQWKAAQARIAELQARIDDLTADDETYYDEALDCRIRRKPRDIG